MVEFAADFNVAVINIAAYSFKVSPIKPPDPYLVAVRNSELFLIVRGNEADALFSLFHVAVQPVPAVAVDEQVFLPLVGLQPYQVGILRRVRPEAERKAVVKAALRVFLAEVSHGVPAFQKAAVLLVAHQGLHDAL